MAKNKKKQFYDLFQTTTSYIRNKLPTNVKSKTKHADTTIDITGFLVDSDYDFVESCGLLQTLNVEWHYFKEGTPAIFPESKDLMDKLLNAKYLFKDDFSLSFPFNTFQVAIPRGLEINGVKIPPFTVMQGPYAELSDKMSNFLAESEIEYDDSNLDAEAIKKNEDFLFISVGTQILPGINRFYQMPQKVFSQVVGSKNVNQYVDIMNAALEKQYIASDISIDKFEVNETSSIEFGILKIIAVLSIYLSATDSIYLKKGLPGTHLVSINMLDKLNKPTPYILKQTDALKKLSNKNSPEEHYRICHLRNLRSPKYYKGEYSHLPLGSRWIFVSDSLVNSKSNGYTPVEL